MLLLANSRCCCPYRCPPHEERRQVRNTFDVLKKKMTVLQKEHLRQC